MCQIYPNLRVIPIWVASSMSSPLDFQTEGPGFESHQPEGHIGFFLFFFNTFFSHHSLKNAQILTNVVCFFCANQDRNFAIELNKWRTTRPKWSRIGPSWRAEMKEQRHMYAVFKMAATMVGPIPLCDVRHHFVNWRRHHREWWR